MTAFDKLCRMLDERGARYFRKEREGKGTLAKVSWVYPTGPDSSDVFIATIVRYGDHLRFRGYLTPEQAIAATLGAGTCQVDVLNTGDCAGYECSEYIMHCNGCGHEFGHVLYNEDGDVWMSERPNFCPNCGCRLEVDA